MADADPRYHPDWLALCAAVVAAPDDDLPRLVAADWVEERGDAARALLIRTQIAFARTDDRDRQQSLFEDAIGLLETHGPRWFGFRPNGWAYTSPRSGKRGLPCVAHFLRGFLDSAVVTLSEWLRVGPEVVREKTVRSIRIADKQPLPYTHRWVFNREQPATMPHQLPVFLLSFFAKGSGSVIGSAGNVEVQFSTRKAAHAALGSACLAWARRPTELLLPHDDPDDPGIGDFLL